MRIVLALGACMLALDAGAQEFFRCTAPDGKITYQQAPCPKASEERKVDATPANTDYDPAQRERVLKQGEEASKRLEERSAKEEAERKRREEQRRQDEQREREARAREAAREPVYIYTWPPGTPRPPWGGYTPKPPTPPGTRPQPVTPGR
jgi:membrane protein involved in colicin uptake